MFYSQYILAKRGPLGKVWLAAHFERRLSKSQIFSTDITTTVDSIIHPSEPLALRLSGQLMLGLVRIFSKKVNYFMIDATDIIWKIDLSMKPGYHKHGAVDIEKATVNVDDTRHYGNISTELEFPEFANTAYVSSLFPVAVAVGRESFAGHPTGVGGHLADFSMTESGASLEFVRVHDRSSLMIGRASETREGRQVSTSLGSAIRFDETLPTFEEKGDFFQESQLVAPFPDFSGVVTPLRGVTELPPVPEVEGTTPSPVQGVIPTVSPPISPEEIKVVRREPKRRKVDEQIQLSNPLIQARMKNVSPILRRSPQDPLPYALGLSVSDIRAQEQSFEEKLFHLDSFCEELRELAMISAAQRPYPFPTVVPEASERNEVVRADAESEIPSAEAARGLRRRKEMIRPSSISEMESLPAADFGSFDFPQTDMSHRSYSGMAERKAMEAGRPSLFREFMVEEERKSSHVPKGEWIQSVENFILQSTNEQGSISFSNLCQGETRKFTARCFLEVLHLKSMNRIQVEQPHAYGDIRLTSVV